MGLSDDTCQLQGLTAEGQCSIQLKIALNKLRVQFTTEKEHTDLIINFLTQLFNNEIARVPCNAASYNIAGDYGRVWMVVSPDEVLSENGRIDFWFPAQALSRNELSALIQSVISSLAIDRSFDIPDDLFEIIQKREYKDVFSEPLYLSCMALGRCLQSFYRAVEELARAKEFVLTDTAIGKAAPARYKANHTGALFYNASTSEIDTGRSDNTTAVLDSLTC